MLVSSTLDGDLFSPQALSDETLVDQLVQRIDEIARGHVSLVRAPRETSLLKRLVTGAQEGLPPNLQQALSRLKDGRILDIVPDATLEARALTFGLSQSGASALSVAEAGGADAAILSAGNMAKLAASGFPSGRCVALNRYSSSIAYRKECLSRGAIALDEMTPERFREEIVRPLVHWSHSVKVYDRFLGGVLAREERNAVSFRETISTIYAAWTQRQCKDRSGRFNIVTLPSWWPDRRTEPRTDEPFRRDAQDVWRALRLDVDDVEVHILSPDSIGGIKWHDRYLWTSVDCVVGFTAGFDATAPGKPLRPQSVYIRNPPDPAVSRDARLSVFDRLIGLLPKAVGARLPSTSVGSPLPDPWRELGLVPAEELS